MDFQHILEYSMGLSGSNFTLNVCLPDNTTTLSKVSEKEIFVAHSLKLLSYLGSNNVSVHDVTFDR